MKKQKFRKEGLKQVKGITLIALVITIIVLLILAGVSIAVLTGKNGILTQANDAKQATADAEKDENRKLDTVESYMKYIQSGNVNVPKLAEGMKAVYWDDSNVEKIQGKDSDFDESKWYSYVAGDNINDSKNSKWANAVTDDGSYWVWIPRYEYKVIEKETGKKAGKIEVKFIPTTQTEADEGYKIQPAFTNGSNNQYANGEWDKEIDGIWVAKYEMSGENASNVNIQPGNISTLATGNKLVSKPNVSSWRNISIGNSYLVSYNYDRNKESHLMKNSEWGAVAYLAHSQYGRNGNEITINNSSDFITGNAGSTVSASQATGTTNAYNTEKGALASTTGNIYGIYDLSGGAWERVAAYITNNNANLKNYGSSFAYDSSKDEYIKTSTKYATVYPCDSSNSNSDTLNYNVFKGETSNNTKRYGDAILETSTSGAGTTSWFDDYSYFPYGGNPFFLRGGGYGNGSSAEIGRAHV